MRDIIRGIEQGSEAWHQLRLGIPTASAFSRILTAAKLQPSTQQEQYIAELNAEWVSGEPCDDFGGNEWVERGKALEPEARKYYTFKTQREVEHIAFIYKDKETRLVGCSPDALVEEEGLLELKCPMLKTHLFWLNRSTLPREHLIQVQGQIWVAGAQWCDFMSYFPEQPPVLMRIYPELPVQAAFDKYMPDFLSSLAASRKWLRGLGCVPASEQLAEPDTGIPVSADACKQSDNGKHWYRADGQCSLCGELQEDAPIPERDEPPLPSLNDTVSAGIKSTLLFQARKVGLKESILEAYIVQKYGSVRNMTLDHLNEAEAWIQRQ